MSGRNGGSRNPSGGAGAGKTTRLLRIAGVVVGSALVAATVVAWPADQGGAPVATTAQDHAAPSGDGELRTVTLLTGDQVRIRDGRVAGVRMAPGREALRVWQYELDGHEHVVPDDAAPLVRAGRVDPRLFDVTELVEQGLDDTAAPDLPIIVEGGLAAPTGSKDTAAVPALGLAAVDTPKVDATTAWSELRRGITGRDDGAVWLNGRVAPTLEDSVPQVGAPEAWAAGFRGDGAKVAVLDTGYDANHPDLAPVVDAAVDFTGEGVQDTSGHGTHVASTIAGTGAASGGRRVGVAPGARLLVGKVLGASGGTEAAIISGMQWAVDQGADVVNMSLGGDPTDGTDLMSRSLDELSESSGVLFVVAAGNSGARATVGAPGAANRALTVGSVTKNDVLSVFSSRGPRVGDHGLKPEIAAPGSDIVAARAAGTHHAESVDESHTRMSGTSMAAPHVAGAAAILAAAHPDWTGEQIKHALVGSARRLPGIDTHGQGAGRLDVTRAVTQRVRAEGVLAFGRAWAGRVEAATRTVTYVNDGDTPVTLSLALEVDSGLFTLESPRVTVPPHGSAPATVTAQVPDTPAGELTGALVATTNDVTLTTPLTASLPGRPHTLTVQVLSRNAAPARSMLIVQDERTGAAQSRLVDDGVATFTVPAGSYRVVGRTATSAATDTATSAATDTATDTLFVHHAGEVARDAAVVVDTALGKEVTSSVDDQDARAQAGGGHVVQSTVDGGSVSVTRGGPVTRRTPLHTIGGPPLPGVALRHFSYWTHPLASVTVDGPDGFELSETYVSTYPRFTGTLSAPVVFVGNADRPAIDAAGDVRGKIALIAPPDWAEPTHPPGQQLRDGIALLAERGARLVVSHFNPMRDRRGARALALPVVMVWNAPDLRDLQARLAQGPVTATVVGRANSPVAYFLADHVTGQVPAGHAFRFARADLGAVDRQLVDTLPDDVYRFQTAAWSADGFTAGADVELDWPARRTDYLSPGASLSIYSAGGFDRNGDFATEVTLPVTVGRGETLTSRVFAAPFGPELTRPPTSKQDGEPLPWAYRQGDRLVLSVPMFADSDPGNVSRFDPTNLGSTVVRKDGAEIARRDDLPALGTFDLPPGPGRFQVVVEANRPAAETMAPPLAVRTGAEWTFHADAGTDLRAALPLLDVRFALPLDDHNRAAAAEPVRGGVAVTHQPGAPPAPVGSLTVEVSYDEGTTWLPAVVEGSGAAWQVRIPVGGTPGGYASLRATAADDVGNAVTETVIRAYALR